MGETVFYIAPEFHLHGDFNAHYLNRTVIPNSAVFSPKLLDPMPDDGDHYIAFTSSSATTYRCSNEPVEVRKITRPNVRLARVLRIIRARNRPFGETGLRDLVQRMVTTVEQSDKRLVGREQQLDVAGVRRIARDRTPMESAGFIARTFFDSELLILR